MLVKTIESIVTGKRGLGRPGVKCRGPECLRIIYGSDYPALSDLERLGERGPGKDRFPARREFALGIEVREHFVAAEPLHRVHE